MLIRSTWNLSLSEPAVLHRAYGLELVKELHRKMDLEMKGEEFPPVSYSAIVGPRTASQDFLTFSPEEVYSLSLCGLNEFASKAIASLDLSPGLELMGAKFETSDRLDEVTSYEELYATFVANEPEPIRRFNLEFITPTAFAQSGIYLPLPLPSLMFRSWLQRWNNFAPVYLGGDDLIGYLERYVAIAQHRIKTRYFQVSRGYVNGFVGDVSLQIGYKTDALLANVANLLVEYAQFSGTGMKTRLGMGYTVVNREVLEDSGRS